MFKLPTILISTGLFGFIAYVGLQISRGQEMGAQRGIMLMITDGLNFLSDLFGPAIAGFGLMGLATLGAVWAAVFIWRSPML